MRDGKDLIREAFQAAKVRGKPEWYRMTTAVLKNRILKIEPRFSEQQYNAITFSEFVSQHADIVRVDSSVMPAVVELIEAVSPRAGAAAVADEPGSRVRADLWRAVLDYASRRRYAWDPDAGRVVDGAGASSDRVLPTVTQEELSKWRHDFAEEQEPMLGPDSAERERLRQWKTAGLRSDALPFRARGPWVGRLKSLVVTRLLEWFKARALEVPADLIVRPSQAIPEKLRRVDELRQAVLACVQVMTEDELEEMRLPAAAVARAAALRQRG